jgi:hypothetical protein
MTATLFDLTFLLIAPFWALMILAPKWSWTQKIAESHLIVLPPVVIYVVLMVPVLPELLPLVTRPELNALAEFMSTDRRGAGVGAHDRVGPVRRALDVPGGASPERPPGGDGTRSGDHDPAGAGRVAAVPDRAQGV